MMANINNGDVTVNAQNNLTLTAPAANERSWAAVCHASGLVGYLGAPALFHILVPLAIWLLGRHNRPFLDDQGKEAVNFQTSLTVYWFLAEIIAIALAVVLTISIVGIPLLVLLAFIAIPLAIAFVVAGIMFAIIAAIRASKGVRYRYPLTIRFIS